MNKVYLVYHRWYDEDTVIGVYLTKEEAIEKLKSLVFDDTVLSYDIEEWDIETQEGKTIVYKDKDGIYYE